MGDVRRPPQHCGVTPVLTLDRSTREELTRTAGLAELGSPFTKGIAPSRGIARVKRHHFSNVPDGCLAKADAAIYDAVPNGIRLLAPDRDGKDQRTSLIEEPADHDHDASSRESLTAAHPTDRLLKNLAILAPSQRIVVGGLTEHSEPNTRARVVDLEVSDLLSNRMLGVDLFGG